MRKLFVFIVLLISLTVSAQTDNSLMPVDWDKIKAEVKANPQRIKSFVEKFTDIDTEFSLTAEEKILAFYGQTYLNNGKDMSVEFDMLRAKKEGKVQESVAIADKVLAINPLNTNAIKFKILHFRELANTDPDKAWMMSDSIKVYSARMLRILDTIFMTGNGSKEHPFYVTAVGDEYNFVYFFLGILEVNSQALIGKCDRLQLGKTNEVYSSPEIYFDITRVLEIEREVFSNDER